MCITSSTALLPVTAPGKPLSVRPFCNVIVWKKPTATNGKITGYEVMFSFSDGTTNTIRVDGDITHYVIAIPISGVIRIKVFYLHV